MKVSFFKYSYLYLLSPFIIIASTSALAIEQSSKKINLGLGSYYYEGDYQLDDPVYTWVQVLSGHYQVGAWKLGIKAPYLHQEGPRYQVSDSDPDLPFEIDVSRQTRSGWGDPIYSASYSWPQNHSMNRWSVMATYKSPIANEDDGLSNGRQELNTYVSNTTRIQRWIVNIRTGYLLREAKHDRNNATRWMLQLGGLYFLSNRSALGAALYHRSQLAHETQTVRQVMTMARYRMTPHWQAGAQFGVGLTDDSPDHMVGLQLQYKFRYH